MLPVSILDALPKAYQEGDDPARDGLVARVDAHLQEWRTEVRELLALARADRMPEQALDAAGEQLAAGILPGDTERVRRQKIASSIERLRLRSTWLSVKPVIDFYAGGDSVILDLINLPQWIWVWDEADVPEGALWAVWGNETDDSWGINWAGGAGELAQEGFVVIDIDNDSISDEALAQIVESLRDVIPAYLRVVLVWGSDNELIIS